MNVLEHLIDASKGKHPISAKRSPEWHAARDAYLKKHPYCAACGYKHFIQVHHIIPFHIAPQFELEEWNFIGLCEPPHRARKCHLILGHLGDFKQYNLQVVKMAEQYFALLKNAHWRAYG